MKILIVLGLLVLLTGPVEVKAKSGLEGVGVTANTPPVEFTYRTNKRNITLTKYIGSGGEVTIPGVINGMPVNTIGSNAFSGCTRLTSVTVPSSIENIETCAFRNCTNLAGIFFKGNAPLLGKSVFSGLNTNTTAVYYFPGNSDWSSRLGGLPAVMLSFTYTISHKAITIVQYNGFGGAVALPAKINGIPVVRIENSAFYACTSLTGITIPNGITSIGENAFRSCTGLIDVAIPASVTNIGDWAFSCCSNLRKVTFSKNTVDIGDSAFSYCTSLASVTLPHVATVRSGTFRYCSRLAIVEFPGDMSSIEDLAFAACSCLSSVTIPASVSKIGDMAFSNCSSLKDVHFKGNAPNLGSAVFEGTSTNMTLYHVSGTTGWNTTFGDRKTVAE